MDKKIIHYTYRRKKDKTIRQLEHYYQIKKR